MTSTTFTSYRTDLATGVLGGVVAEEDAAEGNALSAKVFAATPTVALTSATSASALPANSRPRSTTFPRPPPTLRCTSSSASSTTAMNSPGGSSSSSCSPRSPTSRAAAPASPPAG